MFSDGAWFYFGSVTAGAQLVLLGTLAAGVRFVHIGAPGAGAVLIGTGLGAQVFGASTDVWIVHIAIVRPGGFPIDFAEAVQVICHFALLTTAVGGALLALALHHRYDGRPELAGPSGAEPRMGARTASAGAAATLVFVPAAHLDTVKGGFSVTACWLLLAVGLAAAALAGLRAAVGTVVASAIVVGVSAVLPGKRGMRPFRLMALTAVGGVGPGSRGRGWGIRGLQQRSRTEDGEAVHDNEAALVHGESSSPGVVIGVRNAFAFHAADRSDPNTRWPGRQPTGHRHHSLTIEGPAWSLILSANNNVRPFPGSDLVRE
ncbi:hypothetical protein [Spirillospora sp. NPDC048823]|uniref:hypothetical protein n=1 Tax=unclassified Spirillospora TaxID=2642701 RepID=UPI00371F6EC4